ncbi:MAG: glycosyltransferase family 2 protein [Micrococcales bacterium]|nr:glycosyltransferase family 2 protein [Micrococcales bacterium]MCL2668512.1 glycosyltransferase family 2 protein [Micrococcales bacterium]
MFDDTWLVVPLFNEGAVIADVVTQALQTFDKVVCVDDGSYDGSGDLAQAAGAQVVRHPLNLGQGAALQTGFEYVLADPAMQYAVTFDADGQHQVDDVVAMVELLRTGEVDVVFGSRFLDERTTPSRAKKAVLRVATGMSNLTTGLRLTDAHNGLRAFNRQALQAVHIRQNRMAHASEIVSQVAKAKLRFAESPVHVLYTDYSRSKGQSIWNSVNILTELLYR